MTPSMERAWAVAEQIGNAVAITQNAQMIARAIIEAVDEEREACAKICERYVTPHGRAGSAPSWDESVAHGLADKIRSRGPPLP